MMCYDQAMYHRIQYNDERILQVENEKLEETIVKLVPMHIYKELKSEKLMIDKLDNVTVMFARLRCIEGNFD
jgi:hypothetical protein